MKVVNNHLDSDPATGCEVPNIFCEGVDGLLVAVKIAPNWINAFKYIAHGHVLGENTYSTVWESMPQLQ